MVMVESTMMPLGTAAPDFALPEPATGRVVALKDVAGPKGVVVMFLCNHCPFVKHLADHLAGLARDYAQRGVGFVAINANDADKHPEDAPGTMPAEVKLRGYTFPYLFDATQQVARAYRAACTPDLFVFDSALKLHYRGQYDDSRPKNDKPVTGADLIAAIESAIAGKPAPQRQLPATGCNIKWKPGNEPEYFPKG